MRSYGQHCALAKALDIVGDRWTLLIVRELMLRDRCRYTDLRNGLPGIATNLLATRLKELEASGLVSREEAPPPIATTIFRLTERGRALEPVLYQLGTWGAPLLATPAKGDRFRTYWLGLLMRHSLQAQAAHDPAATIELRTGPDEPLTIEIGNGTVVTRPGAAVRPAAVLTGTPQVVAAVMTGKLTLADARAAGMSFTGDPWVLQRVQPGALATKKRRPRATPSHARGAARRAART
jgi:DNA-binding HxlR family transcriptional regulator